MSDFHAWVRRVESRFYAAIRDRRAGSALNTPAVPWDTTQLTEHTHCLLITYKRDGSPIATPVWFAITDTGMLVHCAQSDGKLKRIRNNPDVTVAACTLRGRPVGPPMDARATVLAEADSATAERALRASFTVRQRIFLMLRGPMKLAHIEITAPARSSIIEGQP